MGSSAPKLILLFCLASTFGMSQHPGIKNFTVENGLPSNETYYVHQDSKGFIWIATDNGVVRFDGLTFETFKIKDGLEDPVVFGIVEDKEGTIWFRTFSGKVFHYNDGKITPWKMNDAIAPFLQHTIPTALVIDSTSNVWISTNLGKLIKVDSTHATLVDSSSRQTTVIREIGGVSIALSSHAIPNLITFNNRDYPIKFDIEQGSIPLSMRWNDKMYVAINNSLFELEGDLCHEVFKTPTRIISLSTDKENQLWVGWVNGARAFKINSFKNGWVPPIANDASVTSVLHDREGGYWLTTLEKGIYFIPQASILNYEIQSKIRSLTAINQGLLIKTYSDNFFKIDSVGNISLRTIPIPGPYGIIHQDRQDKIWVNAFHGLFLIDQNFNMIKSFKSNGASAVSITEDGNKIHALTSHALFTFENYEFVKLSNIRRDFYRFMIKVDSLFYIAGRLGLSVYDDDLVEKKRLNLFDNIKISCLKQVNDSIIAIGTFGYGLYLYNKSSDYVTHFNSNQNFFADNVYSILQKDNDSILWMGTEKGVAKARLKSLLLNKPEVAWLTASNGLISNKINHLKYLNSDIWAFSDEGASCIPINFFSNQIKSVRFYIREILVNGIPRPREEHLKLSHNENNIKIKFGFVSLQNQDIKIRYKLQAGQPWQYTTERLFDLSSLAPNDYQLALQYSVDNFTWNNVDASEVLNFTITPPWWQTVWIQLLAIYFLLLGIFLFIRNRFKNLKLITSYQQRLLRSEIDTSERERLRIVRELLDRVGTDLSAMKMIVGQILQKNGDHQTQQVENNFQEMIKEIKDIIYNLSPPELERFGLFQTIRNYIEKLQTIGPQIRFNTFGKDIVDPELGIAIFRVLQELLSNSLKHSAAKSITIHINSFPDLINIVYEDNGTGFSHESRKIGMGLQNIEARIRSFDGQITFETGTFGVSYSFDIPLPAITND